MTRISEAYTRVGQKLALVSGFLVLIISLFSSFEVVMRYFLNSPTSWTFELSRYLMLVLIMLGTAGTLQNGSHISVDFFVERLPAKIAQWITVLAFAVALVYTLAVLWQSWLFFMEAIQKDWETLGNFPIPSSWLYFFIVLGNFLLSLAFVQKMYEVITGRETEKIKVEV